MPLYTTVNPGPYTFVPVYKPKPLFIFAISLLMNLSLGLRFPIQRKCFTRCGRTFRILIKDPLGPIQCQLRRGYIIAIKFLLVLYEILRQVEIQTRGYTCKVPEHSFSKPLHVLGWRNDGGLFPTTPDEAAFHPALHFFVPRVLSQDVDHAHDKIAARPFYSHDQRVVHDVIGRQEFGIADQQLEHPGEGLIVDKNKPGLPVVLEILVHQHGLGIFLPLDLLFGEPVVEVAFQIIDLDQVVIVKYVFQHDKIEGRLFTSAGPYLHL